MNVANNLSILRVILVPVFVVCLVYASPERAALHQAATLIFIVACLTDALDGYLARRLGQITVFGSYVDPLADKILLTSGFLALSFMTHLPITMRIPAWVTVPVIARDLVILTGAAMMFFTTGSLKAKPLLVSKITTLFQMLTLLGALVSAPPPLQYTLYALTVTLTVISGMSYIRMGGRLMQSSA